jgi:hypothetical protein
MASSDSLIPQHKRMAAGKSAVFARGGSVPSPMPSLPMRARVAVPMSPLEVAKRNNGVPGFKKGGSAKGKDKC